MPKSWLPTHCSLCSSRSLMPIKGHVSFPTVDSSYPDLPLLQFKMTDQGDVTCVPRPSHHHCSNSSTWLFPPGRLVLQFSKETCIPHPENHFWSRCRSLPTVPSVHRQFIPPRLEELTVKRRHGDAWGEREMRMTQKHRLHLLLGRLRGEDEPIG